MEYADVFALSRRTFWRIHLSVGSEPINLEESGNRGRESAVALKGPSAAQTTGSADLTLYCVCNGLLIATLRQCSERAD